MGRPRLPIGAHGAIKVLEIDKGKWRARTLYRFRDGKRRQVERYAKTKAAARNVLLDALSKMEAAPASSSTTVDELMALFMKRKRAAKLAPGTLEGYQNNINGPIRSRLGSLLVAEVTAMHIQEFITAVTESNGPGSAKSCKAVLSGAFKLAIRSNLIRVSPVVGLEAIQSSKKRAAKALPPQELRNLLVAVRTDRLLSERDIPDLWEFMSFTGCRIAEALALRWRFIDRAAGTVTLGPVVTRAKGKGSFIHEPGKTKEWRTIVIPGEAMALLEQRSESVPDAGLDLVFPGAFGQLRSLSSIEMLWWANRERLGYPTFTTHAFRKTVATILDDAGMSARDIADYLGHKNVSMTQDVYMALNTQSGKMAEALSNKVGVKSGLA